MKPEIIAVTAIFLTFALLEALLTGLKDKQGERKGDKIVEGISLGVFVALTQPLVILGGAAVAALLVPQAENVLADWPFWAVFGLFLIFDDMTQYWWHRAAHTWPRLYKLHRPHHDAGYLSVRVVYRNNIFYYGMMPGLWLSGALVFMGGGWVYAIYVIIKMTVIIGAHSDVRWDAPLYRIRALSPLMWLVERTISTPATHSAHHGKYASDSATHYKGNFGNLLFFWDVLFGTAKITRRYPQEFGVENLPATSVGEQLFWPLVRTDRGSREVALSQPET